VGLCHEFEFAINSFLAWISQPSQCRGCPRLVVRFMRGAQCLEFKALKNNFVDIFETWWKYSETSLLNIGIIIISCSMRCSSASRNPGGGGLYRCPWEVEHRLVGLCAWKGALPGWGSAPSKWECQEAVAVLACPSFGHACRFGVRHYPGGLP
jgi:hypothetical protein